MKKLEITVFVSAFLLASMIFVVSVNKLSQRQVSYVSQAMLDRINSNFGQLEERLIQIDQQYPPCSMLAREELMQLTFDSGSVEEISYIQNNTLKCSDRDSHILTSNHTDISVNISALDSRYYFYRDINSRTGNVNLFFMLQGSSGWYRVLLNSGFVNYWLASIATTRHVFACIGYGKQVNPLCQNFSAPHRNPIFDMRTTSEHYPIVVHVGYSPYMLWCQIKSYLYIGLVFILGSACFCTWLTRRFANEQKSQRSDLQRGIEHNEFVNYYQPIIENKTGEWIGAELLVRWHHPRHGLVLPMAFIPKAEETGQICALTLKMIENAANEKLAVMTMKKPFYISVNVTASMIANKAFVEPLIALIQQHQSLRHNFVLEFSERDSFANSDINELKQAMQRLRDVGVTWALDDFGTGYAGLSTLRELSFDIIKIDRSFVAGSATDSVTQSILSNMADMGRTLKCKLIAEGVELKEQAEQIDALGIPYSQGYYYAKPMPFSRFIAKFKIYSMQTTAITRNQHENVGVSA